MQSRASGSGKSTAIADAGYRPQLQQPTINDYEFSVSIIYQQLNSIDGAPDYLVAIWGEDSEIAMLIVDDFSHLMTTLAAIEPLTKYSTKF